MNEPLRATIDALIEDLRPTPAFRREKGLALAALAAAASLALVAATYGWRADLLAGRFEPLFLIANGLLLLLGAAAASAAVTMASPQVGNNHDGWRWAAAMAALLPATVIALVLSGNAPLPASWMSPDDSACMVRGATLGVLTGAALTLWLRRGAPASPRLAGWLVGIAAGSAGMLAFAFHCPLDSLYHVGIWHAAPVLVSALAGRLLVPFAIRW